MEFLAELIRRDMAESCELTDDRFFNGPSFRFVSILTLIMFLSSLLDDDDGAPPQRQTKKKGKKKR